MNECRDITTTKEPSSMGAIKRPVVRPYVDIFENNDELLVVADMPGVSPDDLHLGFENHKLTIEASSTLPAKDFGLLFAEFRDVDYRRNFEVAYDVDVSKITAGIAGGVLTIHLPKSEAVKPKRIQVRVE